MQFFLRISLRVVGMLELNKDRLLHLEVLCKMSAASVCVSLPSAAIKLQFSLCSFSSQAVLGLYCVFPPLVVCVGHFVCSSLYSSGPPYLCVMNPSQLFGYV